MRPIGAGMGVPTINKSHKRHQKAKPANKAKNANNNNEWEGLSHAKPAQNESMIKLVNRQEQGRIRLNRATERNRTAIISEQGTVL